MLVINSINSINSMLLITHQPVSLLSAFRKEIENYLLPESLTLFAVCLVSVAQGILFVQK